MPRAETYDAVLLGSAVVDGGWTGSVVRFLHAQAAHLTQRPTFLFQVVASRTDAAPRPAASAAVRRLAELAGAAEPVTFAGRSDLDRADRWADAVGHDLHGTRSPAASALALSLI